MGVELHLQGPGEPTSSLLSELLEASVNARAGGATFAWCNIHGIRALLFNSTFLTFLDRGPFRLIVGTDTITNELALDVLLERRDALGSLNASAFLHNRPALFHPKLAWFQHPHGMKLLVGSGNFTRGGLQANWEAFINAELSEPEGAVVLRQLSEWEADNAGNILPLDHKSVRDRVRRNAGNERNLRAFGGDAHDLDQLPALGDEFLIAELTKNRGSGGVAQFSQASFPKDVFETFFGVRGTQNELLLYAVESSGDLQPAESTSGKFKPKSVNYYFELAAAAGRAHPPVLHPISAFLKLDSGAFLYLFRLPDEDGYAELSTLLSRHWTPRGNQVRRVRVLRDELAAYWPGCPLLKAAEPAS